MRTNSHRCGFTLVELSIVLIIIGLVAGAIFVGQALIEAATIQSQARQIERYQAAINTFRGKYNGLPGDLVSYEAAGLGFVPRSGARGHGDGNGILEHCNQPPMFSEIPLGCEIILFWSDLSKAGLIEGDFSTATDGDFTTTTFEESLLYFPLAKVRNDITLIPGMDFGVNKLILVTVHLQNHAPLGQTGSNFRLFYPEFAYRVDSKMDDGNPLSGQVRVKESGAFGLDTTGFFAMPPAQGAANCVNAGAYNILLSTGFPVCQLNFLMSF
jgi:prepilin-type N-terminal cleavage/methylation domain-containing protein